MKKTSNKIKFPKDDLWRMYFDNKSTENRNLLVIHYLPLVRFVIQKLNLPKNSIFSHEDVQNIGIFGLIEAVERFDPSLGTKFETFAMLLIRGRIIDEIRRIDWLSRSARKKVQISEKIQSSDIQDETHLSILLDKMNVSNEDFRKFIASYEFTKSFNFVNEVQFVNVDGEEIPFLENFPDTYAIGQLDQLIEEEKIQVILNFLESLPERNRLIMVLYYYENLKFKEIAQILEISESRVSQIHSQIIASLKRKFKELEE
ncbi:MAG: sigma-70 family RNA polymerase sigma factor [Candidatus Kapaibacteriales bacterium]